MKIIIHKAATRGHVNHGWLESYHTFSFAGYYDPSRMNFGALRVLNDDVVEGGGGFGTHPHQNMEIVSIPLSGDLEHKDSMGNVTVIRQNDVQIMSAGTGIYHSEYNKNSNKHVNFLQIWILPKLKNIKPRYDQKTYLPEERKNKLQIVVSPENSGSVFINQDAWFSLGSFKKGFETLYQLNKEGNGVYLFVIDGDITVENQPMKKRDGIGIWQTGQLNIKADSDAELLLIEVPMSL
jgi:quercetin 2,3-dioxygenase